MSKEIIVIICENEEFFKKMTEVYTKDIKGEFNEGITYMGRFKQKFRPEIVEALREID